MPDVCPYCASDSTGVTPSRNRTGRAFSDPLAVEISSIREIARSKQRTAEQQTIERLSQEVVQLRQTVARLRGTAAASRPDGAAAAAPPGNTASALSAPGE